MTYSVDTYKAALIAAYTQLTGLLDEYENPAEALMDLYFEQTLTNITGSVPVYVRGQEIRFDGGDAIVGRLEMIGKPHFRALEPWINGIPDMPEPLAHMKRAIDALEGGPGTPGYEFFKEMGHSAHTTMTHSDDFAERDKALFNLGDDADLLEQLIVMYAEDEDRLVHDIETALTAGDPEALSNAAHALKGAQRQGQGIALHVAHDDQRCHKIIPGGNKGQQRQCE